MITLTLTLTLTITLIEMDIVERLKEFLDNEARACSMDYGCDGRVCF